MARAEKVKFDISAFIKPRDNTSISYSAWYDHTSGKITSVSVHTKEDTGNFITGNDSIFIELLEGKKSFKECMVAYDSELGVRRLMYVKDWVLQVGARHELQVIDYSVEPDVNKQFSLIFYKDQKYVGLDVNHDSFMTMFKMGNEDQLSMIQKQNVTFYVRDKNTGYLIGKHIFEFNIDNNELLEQPAVWLAEYNVEEIDILGHKNLCTYSWTWQEKKIEKVLRVNRTRVIPAISDEDAAHIILVNRDGKLICQSNIGLPSNYNIYEDLKVWVTKREHPDSLIGMITIPVNMIANRKRFEIDIRFLGGKRFDTVDFLTNNQYIRLSKKDQI